MTAFMLCGILAGRSELSTAELSATVPLCTRPTSQTMPSHHSNQELQCLPICPPTHLVSLATLPLSSPVDALPNLLHHC